MLASTALLAAFMLLQRLPVPVLPPPPPPPADLTLPPETAQLVTILEGRGVQVYTCTAGPAGYAWINTAPDAELFNLATGKPAGRHSAGPTWTLSDGSAIYGSVLQTKPADTPADVPWLLLKAAPAPATADATPAATPGTLTPVTLVRRYSTHGGVAPATGCGAEHARETLRVPYTAMYAFYTTPPAEPLTPQPSSAPISPASQPAGAPRALTRRA